MEYIGTVTSIGSIPGEDRGPSGDAFRWPFHGDATGVIHVYMHRFHPNDKGRGFPPLLLVAALVAMMIVFHAGIIHAYEITEQKSSAAKPSKVILTLDQAISVAMQTNRNITYSQYNAESQRYSIDAAKSVFDLKLIPAGGVNLAGGNNSDNQNITAGLQAQKKLEYGTSISITPRITRYSQQYLQQYSTDMGVRIEQPLLRGLGKDINTDSVLSAEFAYRTSLRGIDQTKVNSLLETISAFYEAVRQLELLRLSEKMGARLKGHSEVARAKEKVGLTTPMDTYRAEIPLKETEDALIATSVAYQDARDQIKFILALPQNTELEVIVPESPALNELELNQAIETALKNRIEIEQMKVDIDEAERRSAVLKHNILPDLNLVLEYGRYASADSLGQSTRFDLDRYGVSLQAGTDIFRSAEKAAYQQSLISIKALRLNMEGKMEDIRRQVRKQWLALKEALKRIQIRKSQIKQGEEKLALAEVKFAHRMADNFDIIESEKELQNARANLLAAEIEYSIGMYNMKAVMGTLIPRS